MKKLFLLTFLIGFSAMASYALSPINNDYTDPAKGAFKYAEELWMCSSYSYNIDMSQEAFGVALSNQGSWYELIPGEYQKAKDAGGVALRPTEAQKVQSMAVSNVFNVTGRGAGVYEFVYINSTAGFCGMELDDQAIFRIYVVPELAGFSVNSSICDGATASVNLSLLIPVDIQNFAARVGWTFIFKDNASAAVTMPITVNAGGVKRYTYSVDDSNGAFAGKYPVTGYACAASATITHSVEVSDDAVTAPMPETRTYCLSNLLLQNPVTYKINVSSVLGFTAPNGVWTVDDVNTIVAANGDAVVTMTGRVATSIVTFTYKFTGCDAASTPGETKVILVFGDTELNTEIDDDDITVCRNFKAGEVSLLELLQITVPSTAGMWTTQVGNPEVKYSGTVNLADFQLGRKYIYNYFVSPAAADDLCQLTSFEANLGVTVDDANSLSSGQVQVCKDVYDAGTTSIDLYTHINGLPASAKWYAWNSVTNAFDILIATPAAFPVSSANNVKVGVNQFKFRSDTDCGKSEGSLYLTVTDRMTNYLDKAIKYCFTDDGALSIDVINLLGVGGLTGVWTASGNVAAANFDGVTFKGRAQYESDRPAHDGTEVYTFTYTPAAGEACTDNKPVKLTVTITHDVVI